MMFPYILSIGLIEATRIIKPNTKPKRFFVTLFCGCVLIALVGLRHPSMGYDLRWQDDYGYLGSFQKIAASNWGLKTFQNYEIGYIFFNKVVSLFTNDSQVFLIICAACSIIPFAYVIYKDSADIQTSYIVFFGTPIFTLMFSGLRQSIAIGLLSFSFHFLKKKRWKAFIINVLLAAQFHSSAYLFFIAYPLYHLGNIGKRKGLALSFVAIAFVFRRVLFTYFGWLISEKSTIDNNGSLNMFLFCVGFLIVLLYLFKTDNAEINGLLKIYYFACITLVFTNINIIAMRATYYFLTAIVFLVPTLCNENVKEYARIRVKSKTDLVVIINILFIALGLYFVLTTSWAYAYPYRFFWK